MTFQVMAYFVSHRIDGDFTDAELAAACHKYYGGNEETYRKRCHELRKPPRLLKWSARRKCAVTGKTATSYTCVRMKG